jgi:hypothetical protein
LHAAVLTASLKPMLRFKRSITTLKIEISESVGEIAVCRKENYGQQGDGLVVDIRESAAKQGTGLFDLTMVGNTLYFYNENGIIVSYQK